METAEERLVWLLILSAVPGAITGALLDSLITEHLGAKGLIGAMLVIFGVVLYLAVALLIKLLRTRTFTPFVIYRVAAGLGVIALAASSLR